MKRIVKFLMVVATMVAVGSCVAPENNNASEYLDVTPNNIKGVWQMVSFDNGELFAEGSYYYIVFDRAERTFVTYENTGSMGQFSQTGHYYIEVKGAAVIYGDYDNGLLTPNDWNHRFYVRDLTTTRMVWVAVDNEEVVQVYERAELPEWIEKK